MRKICVVTGTRAEYGLLKPIMKRIKNDESLSLQIIASGTHLLPEFGNTIDLITEDGFEIAARVPIVMSGDSRDLLPHSIGHGIIGFSQAFEVLEPDIVLILGDRYEIFAAAVAACYGRRVLAHISGGDKTGGGFDEYSRHAITKISHIHFPSTKKSAERILKMGEDPKRIIVSGSPSIETIKEIEYSDKIKIARKLGLDEEFPVCLFVYHSISTNPSKASGEIRLLLDSVLEHEHQIVLLYPNVDPGSRQIIETIEEYGTKFPEKIKLIKNLTHSDYLNVMNIADFMIGNSSSGIVESASLGIPVINIGNRQEGRECAENVLHIDCLKNEIRNAIDICLNNSEFRSKAANCVSPYGEGKTSEIICEALKNLEINEELFSKRINYD